MFQLKCSIEKVSTLANKCLSVLIHTQDISGFKPEELVKMFDLTDKEVWVAFNELSVKEQEIDIKEDIELQGKSSHKRLYDIILRYCKTKEGNFDNANSLYKKVMSAISEQYLDKIRELDEPNNIQQ